ncbi:MAG: T9SS C-terminal target domain-containing protein [Stygiobacter sp.]|nr:MAG: T9SS C-terminal target domain-containing protein [Stygiobacter sp.]
MQPLDYKIPTDIYFADFDGDWNVDNDQYYGEISNDSPDYEPEIFVGRLLCSSSQDIQNWTNKLILYEKNPGKGSFDYLTRSLMNEADQMQDGGEANSVRNNLPAVFNNGNDPIISETPSAYSATPTYPTGANIITQFNNNIYGLWSWFNHGTPVGFTAKSAYYDNTPRNLLTTLDSYSFQTPETGNGLDNLNNANFPAVVYSICCDVTPFDDYSPNNWYDGYRNMGEGFTVMGQYGGPNLLGNTRYGWVTNSSQMYSLFAGLLNSTSTHLGVAEAISKSNYGNHYLAYSHNLIGCPETQLWTATPSYFSNVSITDNGTSISVNTGVAHSTVSIFNANSSSEYLYRVTDTQNCTFNTSTRPLYITILAQNYIPFFAVTGGSFTQNITVPIDETLNIYPGTTLSFASGTGILVSGKLNAVGNSSNSITFTKSGSNNWSGIQFNSGSSGNLDYCTIQYAGNGIYCYNSSPTIKHSTLDNNSGSGLYLNNHSSPVLVGNNFRFNGSYGIRCESYSSPNLTDNGYPGSNVIRNNSSGGISSYYYSNPNLLGYMTYGNSVFDNTGYEVSATSNCTINAQIVYWGSGATYYESGSTIDRSNALTTNPNPNRSIIISGGDTEQALSAKAVSLKIASDEINKALEKLKDKKYDEAIPMFLEIFRNNADALLGKYALCKIEECYTQAGKKDYVAYSKSVIKPILKEGTETYVVALELEAHQMVNADLYMNAINNLQTILKKYNLNSDIDKNTLFTLGAVYSLYLGDKANSDKYFGELKKRYSNDELINQIEIIKSFGTVTSSYNQNGEIILPYDLTNDVGTTSEELFSNYPNPFNPSTRISFTLKERGKVSLKVYDILGKEVANLADGFFESGKHVTAFDGSNLASGVYFYRLVTPNATISKKMMLMK